MRSASAEGNADPEVIRRALPLSHGSRRGRMRRRRSRSPNRRTSYMEAMESSEDLTVSVLQDVFPSMSKWLSYHPMIPLVLLVFVCM